MTVLHVIAGLETGGAEGALFRLVAADRSNAHTVVSMTTEGVFGPRLVGAGARVQALGMPRGRVTWRGLRQLFLLIKGSNPDVIQTWMYHADVIAGWVARAARRRAIAWSVRASDAHHFTGLASRTIVMMARASANHVPSAIVFASQTGRALHLKAGYPADRSCVIPNGYDTDALKPDPDARSRQRRAWCIPESIAVFGTVARWDPLKDHATLLSACAVLADAADGWLLVLVGPGMDDGNAALRRLIVERRLAARVILAGATHDINAVMNAFDVHVLSSISEAFPNVLPEAMACGTPCVTTDVGDAKLIVSDTGWVVPRSNPELLAEAMRTAIRDRADAEGWNWRQRACRDRIAAEFSIGQMVERYRRTWRDIALNA